jgi:hypothetical protein
LIADENELVKKAAYEWWWHVDYKVKGIIADADERRLKDYYR